MLVVQLKRANTCVRRLLNWGDRSEADREAAAKRTTSEAMSREGSGAAGPNMSLAAKADVVEQVRLHAGLHDDTAMVQRQGRVLL